MKKERPTYRYERKFVVSNYTYPLSLFLKTLSVPFREAYPSRIINNVYFDTADFQSLAENIHGKSDRVKIRMRWYDELTTHKVYHPKLEYKIKRSLLGTKKVYSLGNVARRKDLLDKKSIYSNFEDSDLPADVMHDLKKRQPVLINRYQRKYYESLDRLIRITLDTKIDFRKFNNRPSGIGSAINVPDILELKYDEGREDYGRRVGNMLPFRLSKFSKYQLGMEQTFFYHAH